MNHRLKDSPLRLHSCAPAHAASDLATRVCPGSGEIWGQRPGEDSVKHMNSYVLTTFSSAYKKQHLKKKRNANFCQNSAY